jgi:hypothetical protein
MPEFILTSPDGQKFRITAPEGATGDQLPDLSRAQGTRKEAVMPRYEVEMGGKRYEVEAPSPEAAYEAWNRRQGGGKALPPSMRKDDMSAVEQFKTGFMDPFYGVEELRRQTLGDPSFEETVQQREADLRKRMPQGFSVPRAVGAAVSPLNLLAGKGAAGVGSRILGGIAGGAAGSVTQPTSGAGDYWTEKLEQLGEGAVAGGALGAAGAAVEGAPRLLTPYPLNQRRQQFVNTLRREGSSRRRRCRVERNFYSMRNPILAGCPALVDKKPTKECSNSSPGRRCDGLV